MSKKPETTKPATGGDADATPKKRSRLKLALVALLPLVLAGGAYAGWTFFLAPGGDEAHAEAALHDAEPGHEAASEGHAAEDMMKVSSIAPEIRAETSATQTYALSVLMADQCGAPPAPALKAASEAEALADGAIVNLSWEAAVRRTRGPLTEKACGYLWGEVEDAELALAAPAAPAKGGHGEPAADAHAKPAH